MHTFFLALQYPNVVDPCLEIFCQIRPKSQTKPRSVRRPMIYCQTQTKNVIGFKYTVKKQWGPEWEKGGVESASVLEKSSTWKWRLEHLQAGKIFAFHLPRLDSSLHPKGHKSITVLETWEKCPIPPFFWENQNYLQKLTYRHPCQHLS